MTIAKHERSPSKSRAIDPETQRRMFERQVRKIVDDVRDALMRPQNWRAKALIGSVVVEKIGSNAALQRAVQERLSLPVQLKEYAAGIGYELEFDNTGAGRELAYSYHRLRLWQVVESARTVAGQLNRLRYNLDQKMGDTRSELVAGIQHTTDMHHSLRRLTCGFAQCRCEQELIENYDMDSTLMPWYKSVVHADVLAVSCEAANRVLDDPALGQSLVDSCKSIADFESKIAPLMDKDASALIAAEAKRLHEEFVESKEEPLDMYFPESGLGLQVKITMPFALVTRRFYQDHPELSYLEFGPALSTDDVEGFNGRPVVKRTDKAKKITHVLAHFRNTEPGNRAMAGLHIKRTNQLRELIVATKDAIDEAVKIAIERGTCKDEDDDDEDEDEVDHIDLDKETPTTIAERFDRVIARLKATVVHNNLCYCGH